MGWHAPVGDQLPLREMARVCKPGGRFWITVCTRPSSKKWNGEELHLTVQPPEWWQEQFKLVSDDVSCEKIGGRVDAWMFRGTFRGTGNDSA